jgi:hypothetical protein
MAELKGGKGSDMSIIISLIGALAGWLDSEKKDKQLKELNSKLDLLLGLCNQILDELIALRVYIKQELVAAFRDHDVRELVAAQQAAKDTMNAVKDPRHVTKEKRDELSQHFIHTREITYRVMGYGYATIPAVIAGCVTTLAVGALGSFDRKELQAFYDALLNYFQTSLINDQNNYPNSLASTWQVARNNHEAQWQFVRQVFPRHGYLGEGDAPSDEAIEAWYLTLTGDPSADYNSRHGFRFGTDGPEGQYEDTIVSHEPHYSRFVPGINEFISHQDGAQDEANKVMRYIGAREESSDEYWEQATGLGAMMDQLETFLVTFRKLRPHLALPMGRPIPKK